MIKCVIDSNYLKPKSPKKRTNRNSDTMILNDSKYECHDEIDTGCDTTRLLTIIKCHFIPRV